MSQTSKQVEDRDIKAMIRIVMAGSKIYCRLLMLVCIIPFTHSQQVAVVAFNTQWCTTLGVNEGSLFTICAHIVFINGSQSLPFDVIVRFNETNGTAKSGIDFFDVSVDRTFPAGSIAFQNPACVSIQTINDLIVGATKTFTLNLNTNNAQVTIADRAIGNSLIVSIYNIDVTTVVMNASTISVNENIAVVPICIVITTGTVSTAISVTLQTIAGTATAPNDYTSISVTVTIPANSIGTCTAITLVDDIFVEGGTSNFTAKITGSTYIAVPANRSTTVITIIDIDVVTFGFWANNPLTVLESSTTVQICAQIMNNVVLGIPVTVELRVTGVTAKNGSDFISPSAINITFWTGDVMGNINCTPIIILQDNILENNEDISLSLNSYFSYVNISKTSGNTILTIIEDTDGVTLGFSSRTFIANEGTGAPCQICIQLLAGTLEKSIHAYVTTGELGTAKSYIDYIPLSSADIVFQSGASGQLNSTSCINFTVIDDYAIESNETVPLSVSSTSPVSTLQASSTATVIIYDQTDYVQIGVISPDFVTEGVNLTATICAVILDGILGRSVVVRVNLMNITADPGIDYETTSASFVFTNGQATGDRQCFMVAIYHNVIVEDPEFFSVNLTTLDPDVIIPQGHGSATIAIYDDPDDKITFGMRSSLLYFKETDVSMPICVVLLSGLLDKNLPVGIVSTDVTAFAYRDYKLVNTTIVFNSSVAQGQSLCTDIYFIDDNIVEYSDEYFILTLIPIDTVHTIIQIPQAIVHIEEDTDDVVSIGALYTKYNVYESLPATLCAVILNGAVERPVSVFATTTSITAIENVDYQGVRSYELVFPPGSTENSTVCLNISTFNDTVIQADRTFYIGLQKFDPSVLLTGSVSTLVTVKQNPIDSVVLRMQDATIHVTEGINTSVAVCVLFEAASGTLKRIALGTLVPINSTAKDIQDYVIPTYTVSFPALSVVGSPPSCISINIIDDNLVGKTDVLQLLLLSTDPVHVDLNFAVTTITIYEDPNDYIEVGMEYALLNVTEENLIAMVCVLITAGVLEDSVTVTLQTYPITAIDGKDYIGGEFKLTFSPGQSMSGNNSQCIDLIIINDHLLEHNETLLILLNSTKEDANIVKVSSAGAELLLTILEISPSDTIQIGMTPPLYRQVVEGQQPVVTICAGLYDGELGRNLTVVLTIINSSLGHTALFGLNYLLQSQTLTFAYNELNNISNTPCTNVTIIDNNIPENELYITIGLSVASEDRNMVNIIQGMNQTTIAILDDDHDIVIGFDEPMLQVTEGINMSIFVCGFVRSQTGIWKMNLSASIIPTDGTAKDFEDYILENDTITFPLWSHAGGMKWCAAIVVLDDGIVENIEQVTLQLISTNPLVVVDGNSSTLIINIEDDSNDYIVVEMQYSSLDVSESNSTAMLCTIITSGILERNATVTMQTHSISAINGKDYNGGQFILVFTSGQSAAGNNLQCIDLIIIDDHVLENNETLIVTLNSTVQDADIVQISPTKRELLLTIIESATVDYIQIGMMETYYQVVEGEKPFISICAVLYEGKLGRDLSIMLQIENSSLGETAIPGYDFILQSHVLTFVYDELHNITSTPCVNVTIVDDNIPENECYITIGLMTTSNEISNVAIVTEKNQTSIAILDDDHGITVGFSIPFLQVKSVNASILVCGFLISSTGIWKSNLTAMIQVTNATAQEPQDYVLPNGTMIFPSWSSSGGNAWCTPVHIMNNYLVEDSKQFTLHLISSNPSVMVDGNFSTTTVEISNNYIEVQMEYTSIHISEKNSSAIVCAIMTAGSLGKNVTVTLETHPITAMDGKDYIGGQFTLTFMSGQSAAGNNLQCINIIVIDDETLENDETLVVSLNTTQQDSGFVRISFIQSASLLTIMEDPEDHAYFGMVEQYFEVHGSEEIFVPICAILQAGKLGYDVNLMLSIQNSTLKTIATPGLDYYLTSNTLVFKKGESSAQNSTHCTNVTLIDNTVVTDERYIIIDLTTLPNETNAAIIISERNETTINIIYNSHAFIVGMQYNHYTVNEMADHIQICLVVLDTTPRVESSVNINITSAGTARVGSEYIMPDVLTIDTTNSMIGDVFCLNVTILDDHAVENDKYFIVSLTPQVSKHFGIMPNSSTSIVTITEDTSDHVDIAFEKAEYIISNSISTLTKVCIQITNGTLERNATVTISTDFNDIISAINSIPLLEEITFMPNGATIMCINLTVLVDLKSSGKTLSLFITTKDKAVHVTQNTTIIKIQSQLSTSIFLTPQGTVAVITVWILLSLCILCCIMSCLALWWKKNKNKNKKKNQIQPEQLNDIKVLTKIQFTSMTEWEPNARISENMNYETSNGTTDPPTNLLDKDNDNLLTRKEAWI